MSQGHDIPIAMPNCIERLEARLLLSTVFAGFGAQQTFAAGTDPSSNVLADVNNDGKLDLVVGHRSGSNVSVLLGNGNGTFQSQQTFATGTGPRSVAAADVNGDGKPDLIADNSSSGTISILVGNGNGTFQSQQTFAAAGSSVFVTTADVNQDGKPDLLVANFSGSVGVLLGNGNGTFQAEQTFAAALGPISVAALDLNGDGRADLVVANRAGGSVSVLLGNGNGTFASQQTFATADTPQSVAISDLNGDGKPDLAVSSLTNPGLVSVLLANGNGTFQTAQTFPAGYSRSLAVSDVNGDGIADLVIANYGVFGSANSVSVLLGNGNGTFQPQKTFGVGSAPYAVAVADVNGDGRADIVTANYLSASASVLLGDLDTISGTSGNDNINLKKDTDGTDIDWTMGNFAGQLQINDPNGLSITGNGGNDTIALSGSNPLPNILHLNGTFTISGLSASNPLANTMVEIGRSTVYIAYGGSDPLMMIEGYLKNGFNGGAWNGTPTASTGVITSIPGAQNSKQSTAIGYADSVDGLVGGQPSNTIELKYTLYGDTGLSGSIGFNNFTRLTQHYNATSGATWDSGDFNYDGSINFTDFTLMTRTYNTSLGSQAVHAGTGVIVALEKQRASRARPRRPCHGRVN